MKLTNAALAVALALGTFTAAAPAGAQKAAPAAAEKQPPCNFSKISSKARKPVSELQTAVNAKDTAAIAAKLAAAQAAASSPEDRCTVGLFQLQAGLNAKDEAAIRAGLQAMVGSGGLAPSRTSEFQLMLAQSHLQAKQYDQAAALLDRVSASDPNNSDVLLMLADLRGKQGRAAESVAMLQKAIAANKAAGRPVPEQWYKVAINNSMKAKLPATLDLTKDWVAAYPTTTNWRDTLVIYQQMTPGADNNLDVFRLLRMANAMTGENDFYRYANAALLKGLPGEAKAVLDEGFAANKISKSTDVFSQVYANASKKAALDKPTLPASEKAAMAAANARPAMNTADAYFSYGEYAKAAALYKVALGKPGVDAGLANLRLGEALARSGDVAGATAAFKAVTGSNAAVANYWLLYLSKRG